MQLRPYQLEARDAIFREWEEGNRKTLLTLPTGTGKTIVFAGVAEERVRQGDRVLVLAHRSELLDQAADKIAKVTGLACAVEKAEDTSVESWLRVVVGSVQTLMRQKRLDQFEPDHFGTIIVDEAHHAVSDSYQRVLNYFDEAKVLGVTATPDRGDMRSLGTFFDSLAYEYLLPQAIKDGYLSPIKAQTIPLKLDLTAVRQTQGDYNVSDIGTALDPYLWQIADEMVSYCKGRKTVVFLPLIATSQKFCRILHEKGFTAEEVNGESKDRTDILERFDCGGIDVLCNSMLLTEGWDCPSVDCIVILRPTKIRSLYAQMVGRGTRLFPGKDHLLLLDFLWHTTRHDLCRPAHLIAKSDDIANRMSQIVEDSASPMDLEQLEMDAEGQVVAEREESLAKQLAEARNRQRKLVDPIQYEMSIQAEDLIDYSPTFPWEMAPASAAQLASLEKFGIFPDEINNAGKASLLLKRLQSRRIMGLATPKQIRLLEKKGFKNVGTWRFQEAGSMIDSIAQNNWRIPAGIIPANFNPAERSIGAWTRSIS